MILLCLELKLSNEFPAFDNSADDNVIIVELAVVHPTIRENTGTCGSHSVGRSSEERADRSFGNQMLQENPPK